MTFIRSMGPAPAPAPGTVLSKKKAAVQFSAQPQPAPATEKPQRSWFGKMALTVAMLTPFLPMAAGNAAAQNRSGADIHDEMTVTEAKDTPALNRNWQGVFAEVLNKPLTSEAGYASVRRMLEQCYIDPDCGKIKFVAAPQTPPNFNNSELARQYVNQMELGTRDNPNGFAVVINAQSFRDSARGTIGYMPGDAFSRYFQQAHGGSVRNAIANEVQRRVFEPRNRATEAAQRGDQATAQRLRDDAFIAMADIFTTELRRATAWNREQRGAQQAQRERAQQPDLSEAQRRAEMERIEAQSRRTDAQVEADKTDLTNMFMILAALAAGAGALGGGALIVRGVRRRREFAKDVEIITKSLTALDSSYKLKPSRESVYSAETLRALLNPEDSANVKAEAVADYVSAVENVMNDLPKEQMPRARELFLTDGLANAVAEVRGQSLGYIKQGGVDSEAFDTLKAFIATEASADNLKAATGMMLGAMNETHVDEFSRPEYLENEHAEIRSMSAQLLAKYPNAGTMPLFFDRLAKESDRSIVSTLHNGIVAQGKTFARDNAELLVAGIAADRPTIVRSAAAGAMGASRLAPFFAPLKTTYLANREAALDTSFGDALIATVLPGNLPELHQALGNTSASEREEKLALTLLSASALKNEASVPVLFDYLDRDNARFPQMAAELLNGLLEPKHRPVLLERVTGLNPSAANKNAFLVSVHALGKMGNGNDLPALMEAFGKDSDNKVEKALLQAMSNLKLTQGNFGYLSNVLTTNRDHNPKVRIAAINLLDNFGAKALDTLVTALRNTNGSTQTREVEALESSITNIGSAKDQFATMLEYANDKHARVRNVAAKAVVARMEKDSRDKDYDTAGYMAELASLYGHPHSEISNKARAEYQKQVAAEVAHVENLGRRGDIHRKGTGDELKRRRDDVSKEEVVREAARKALKKLAQRVREYEAEQARRKAQEEEERRRRRSESNTTIIVGGGWSGGSSSSGGGGWTSTPTPSPTPSDFGGGGGFSSGGGGDNL